MKLQFQQKTGKHTVVIGTVPAIPKNRCIGNAKKLKTSLEARGYVVQNNNSFIAANLAASNNLWIYFLGYV